MSTLKKSRKDLLKDLIFIFIGIAIALTLHQLGVIDSIARFAGGSILSILVVGLFFTSTFTIAPAAVALIHLSNYAPLSEIVLFGAIGAMIGDSIMFFFIRDRFADDIINSIRPSIKKHIAHSFHFGFLKWISPLVGALIIASPIPDEIGLGLMGISKVRTVVLLPVAFVMNALGVYMTVYVSNLI